MDSTVGLIEVEHCADFYRKLQNCTRITFINIIQCVFDNSLANYFESQVMKDTYEENPIVFFMDGFDDTHKLKFIRYFFNMDKSYLSTVINVGMFFTKFRAEIKYRHKKIFNWSEYISSEKLKHIDKRCVDVFCNLTFQEREELVGWYNNDCLLN